MPEFDAQVPLGLLVARHPQLTRTLEGLGLDYCCGGRRTLAEAVAEKGLELVQVLTRLDQALDSEAGSCAAAWLDKPPSELVDHIVSQHHGYLRTELPRLQVLAEKVFNLHGARFPHLGELQRILGRFRDEIESHLDKEEQILFPAIVTCQNRGSALPQGQGVLARGPIACMESEHDDAGAALDQMRTLCQGFAAPEEACSSWRSLYKGLEDLESDMHRHVHEENNILFERVRAEGW